jgi:hypothetical protein
MDAQIENERWMLRWPAKWWKIVCRTDPSPDEYSSCLGVIHALLMFWRLQDSGFSDIVLGCRKEKVMKKKINKGKNARISENFNTNSRNFTVNQIVILLWQDVLYTCPRQSFFCGLARKYMEQDWTYSFVATDYWVAAREQANWLRTQQQVNIIEGNRRNKNNKSRTWAIRVPHLWFSASHLSGSNICMIIEPIFIIGIPIDESRMWGSPSSRWTDARWVSSWLAAMEESSRIFIPDLLRTGLGGWTAFFSTRRSYTVFISLGRPRGRGLDGLNGVDLLRLCRLLTRKEHDFSCLEAREGVQTSK